MRHAILACLATIALSGTIAAAASSGWKVQRTPNPPGAVSSYLSGIDCTSLKACLAVGYSSKMATLGVPLSESWNGAHWTLEPTPARPGASHTYLNSISCTSTGECIAAGYSETASGSESTLVERWNGTKWKIQRTPNPHGAAVAYLTGVSCTSAKACIAVGYYSRYVPVGSPLAERWDGKSWTLQHVPSTPGAAHTYLASISCTSARACTAVGDSSTASGTEATVAERWDGKHWTVQRSRSPRNAQDSYLTAVSCTSGSSCVAVGSMSTGSVPAGAAALAESWNGKRWRIQPTPSPRHATSSYLTGVSCTSAHACIAVGYYSATQTAGSAFAERWTGTNWTLEHTSAPAGATHTNLRAVRCTSARACTGVGDFDNSAGKQLTLAERRG